MPKTIQIGGLALRERPGFRDELTRLRQRRSRPKRQKSDHQQLRVCENPDADWGCCRALTAGGKRCNRIIDNTHTFFCCAHNPLKELKDYMPTGLKPIQKALDQIGFRGHIIKFQHYYFQFLSDPPKRQKKLVQHPFFRYQTKFKKFSDAFLSEWIALAMQAEMAAYGPMTCHSCGTKFKQAWGTGRACITCGWEYCTKCFDKHLESDEHKHPVKMRLLLNDADVADKAWKEFEEQAIEEFQEGINHN